LCTALILSYLARRRSHVHETNGSNTAGGDGELTKGRKKVGEQPGLLNATPWGKKGFQKGRNAPDRLGEAGKSSPQFEPGADRLMWI